MYVNCQALARTVAQMGKNRPRTPNARRAHARQWSQECALLSIRTKPATADACYVNHRRYATRNTPEESWRRRGRASARGENARPSYPSPAEPGGGAESSGVARQRQSARCTSGQVEPGGSGRRPAARTQPRFGSSQAASDVGSQRTLSSRRRRGTCPRGSRRCSCGCGTGS